MASKLFVTLIITVLFVIGCRRDKTPVPTIVSPVAAYCGEGTVSFSGKVLPIITAQCGACHDQTSSFKIYDYTTTKNYAQSGQLVGCISGNPNYQAMPISGPLDSCSIKIIQNWVNQGMLDN